MNEKGQFCEKYTRIALFLAFKGNLHDKFLTKTPAKTGKKGL